MPMSQTSAMLYTAFEQQARALWPMRAWAQATVPMLGNGHGTPSQRQMAAAIETMRLAEITHRRPDWDIASAGGHAVHEQAVMRTPFATLTRFAKPDAPAQPRVLLVAPMSGHFATLLRETVRTMLADHDVYVTDWIDARMVPAAEGPFTLDDYVGYVREFIRHVDAGRAHVMAVCQPAVPVLAAAALMATAGEVEPRSLTLMGGSIDARCSRTPVTDFASNHSMQWFQTHLIHEVPAVYPGRGRPVYPGFMQHVGFMAMNPVRHWSSHWDFYMHLVDGDLDGAEEHRRFYDEYNAVLDMPAEYYLDTVKTVFQDYALPKGRMFVRDELVRPQAIRDSALLTIEGELDDISGNGQTEAAHALCLNIPRERREHFVAAGVGHYGIFSGRRWREMIFPRVREFIRRYTS
jgi:poly(3-hydroxybutyrate) depolymerase